MNELSPDFLLANADLVRPLAPWCVWLDNLEMAILLLAQPWLAGGGLRRAALERQLLRLGNDMPLGAVYFQRISRSVAALEERGQMRGHGSGRARSFTVTPEGFAALILNLQVMRSDPTVDGSEFEFKRALVAICSLILDCLSSRSSELEVGTEVGGFLDAVEGLDLWDRPVVTDRILADAFDVMHLIDVQRARVRDLLEGAEHRLERSRAAARMMEGVRPRLPDVVGDVGGAHQLHRLVDAVWPLAAGAAPELAARAAVIRFTVYLEYLDRLASLYSERLGVVDLATFRRVVGGG